MISIDAYRISIGNFAICSQKGLKSIWKTMKLGSFLESNGLRQLLKPAPFIALFVFLTFAFPKAYETIKPNQLFTVPPLNHVYALRNGFFVEYRNQTLLFFIKCDFFPPYLKRNISLFLSGDIELNPGPPTNDVALNSVLCGNPDRVLQGSFNQSDKRFGITAGIQ